MPKRRFMAGLRRRSVCPMEKRLEEPQYSRQPAGICAVMGRKTTGSTRKMNFIWAFTCGVDIVY